MLRTIDSDQLGPEALQAANVAFARLTKKLELDDASDRLRAIVERTVIDIAKTGVDDAAEIYERAVEALCDPSNPFD